ncbi:MAG: hypothetical protein ACMXX9_03980 [Candidatus Woesearchaeota archaeon]
MYVQVIKKGCPICESDVAGNTRIKYLCLNCNLLFNFKDLNSKKIEEVKTDNPKLDWTKKTLK